MFWVFLILSIAVVLVRVLSHGKRGDKEVFLQKASPPPLSSPLSAPLLWVGKGESLTAGSYHVEGPNTYVCHGIASWEEASCIYTQLPIGQPFAVQSQELGYYPQYKSMTPEQRAYYLLWLSTGRKVPLSDIGYAFVFFYGLERRALVDNASIETVLTEATRLIFHYSSSRSFFGYASRFIAFVVARTGLDRLPKESFDEIFHASLNDYDETTLAVALAWHCQTETPLSSRLAFEVMRNDIRASRSVVITRVAEHFKKLFARKYEECYGEGMPLKASARVRVIEYRPASPTLLFALTRDNRLEVRIPNVLGMPSQFKPLLELWDACIEELKPLSRQFGKEGEVLTREAYLALPDALKKEIDHPDKIRWEQFVASHTGDGSLAFATAGELAILQGYSECVKLTSRQTKELAVTANAVGFALVPDPHVTECTYKWDDMIALFRPEDNVLTPTDNRYRTAVLLLEMGIAVAAADGVIEQVETERIITFLKNQFLLTPNDARRIDAYTGLLLKKPPELAKLGKRLQASVSPDSLELVCRFLVGVAAADGTLDKRERTVLRRFYVALGLTPEKLDEVVASLFTATPDTVEIQRGNEPSGEPIPPQTKHPIFTLNEKALRTILLETEQVARILSDALASADGESEIAPDTLSAPSEEEKPATAGTSSVQAMPEASVTCHFHGLDLRYHAILTEILTRDEWAPNEFSTLARKHACMPSGLIECVNTWSDETYGDLLIEENETYTVNRKLMEEQHA